MFSHRTSAYLTPDLVSANAVEEIKRVVEWFPTFITKCFGFELKLNQESTSADFAFICKRGSAGARMFDGTSTTTTLREELLANPVWRNVSRFCQSWAANDATGFDNIRHFWIEIDINKQQGVPVPNIFLGIPQKHPPDVEWLIPVLETFDYPASNEFLRLLDEIVQISAFDNKNFQIGMMFSRKTGRMRLVFHNVGKNIYDALKALGVEDRELHDLACDLLRVTDFLNLAFDIGESIGPKIGIESQQFSGNIRKDQPRWLEAVHHLVSLGCCAPSKADAILKWPGSSLEKLRHRLIPVLRSINHFKIDWQPGMPLQAKAYLLVQYF